MTFPHPSGARTRRVALGIAAVASTGLIAACGSSASSSTSTSTSASGSTSNRAAFTKCLQQHGVTPPPGAANGAKPGARSGTPPAGGGGFAQNPARQAAFKACGATGQHPRSAG
jgi:hypothetical protein